MLKKKKNNVIEPETTPETNNKNKKKLKHVHEKEEKHDWFIDASFKAVKYIEDNKKKVMMGFAGLTFIIIIIIALFIYRGISKTEISDLYYDASTDFITKLKNAENDKLSGRVISDDEKNQLRKDYLKILSLSRSKPESYLSMYNLGVIYYSIQDYKNAVKYFNDASESKFIFSYKAQLNVGHSFFNIGYQHHEEKEYEKAINNYQAAYESYKSISSKFPNAPALPITYRYRGLAKEYIADVYKDQNLKEKAKNAYNESKKEYDELINLLLKDKRYIAIFDSLMPDVELASRRVEIKIKQLN
ncbi:MAG: tetratricopeptide repeat protein [Spirochaetota bacterium]|nr:tetratricopeptide repeat protein [Spirochaetota bacterium]